MAKILLICELRKLDNWRSAPSQVMARFLMRAMLLKRAVGVAMMLPLSISDNEHYWILKVPAISHLSLRILWKLNFQLNSVFEFSTFTDSAFY